MSRLTLESLMAPGGLLDAGSRLTQTLMTVPHQRKLAVMQAEAEAAKFDTAKKVQFLSTQLTNLQRRAEQIRNAIGASDKLTLAAELKGQRGQASKLRQEAAKIALKSVADLSQEALGSLLADPAELPAKLQSQAGAVIPGVEELVAKAKAEGLSPAQIKDAILMHIQRYGESPDDPEIRDLDAKIMAVGRAAQSDDDLLRKELRDVLTEYDQYLDQYRQLVGMAPIEHVFGRVGLAPPAPELVRPDEAARVPPLPTTEDDIIQQITGRKPVDPRTGTLLTPEQTTALNQQLAPSFAAIYTPTEQETRQQYSTAAHQPLAVADLPPLIRPLVAESEDLLARNRQRREMANRYPPDSRFVARVSAVPETVNQPQLQIYKRMLDALGGVDPAAADAQLAALAQLTGPQIDTRLAQAPLAAQVRSRQAPLGQQDAVFAEILRRALMRPVQLNPAADPGR